MPKPSTHPAGSAQARAAKARSFRQIRQARKQADYWRTRWQTHPETMGANLRRINTERQQLAGQRTARLLAVLENLPQLVKSWELRPAIAASLAKLGHATDAKAVERFLSAVRRRDLIAFDEKTLTWSPRNR